MARVTSILDLIGNTPLVDVSSLSPNPDVRILIKLEGQNPGGSVKDRIALSMVEEAEKDGRLSPGDILLEPSSGNTGIGLALVARVKGYHLKVVLPSNVSVERRQLLRCGVPRSSSRPATEGSNGAVRMAERIHAEHPEWVFLYQYANAANPKAHYEGTGPEIWRDCPEVTHFVAGLGTSGTLLGVGRFLKERNPAVEVWAVEPPAGEMVDGLRNLDDGYIPPIFAELGGQELLDRKTMVGPAPVGGVDPAAGRGGRVRRDLVGCGHGGSGQVRAGHRIRGHRGRVGRRRMEVPVDRGVDRRPRRRGRAGQAHHLLRAPSDAPPGTTGRCLLRLAAQRHGGVGLEDPEAEALLEVERHGFGVVRRVADRDVLSGLEDEVPAPQAEHDAALDSRRPHQGAAQDLAEVVEEQVAAVLGGVDDLGVDARRQGQPVGPSDPRAAQHVDGLGHGGGVVLGVGGQRERAGATCSR